MDTALGRPSVGMTRSLLTRENRSNIGIVDPTKVLSRVLAMGAVASFASRLAFIVSRALSMIGRYRRKHLRTHLRPLVQLRFAARKPFSGTSWPART